MQGNDTKGERMSLRAVIGFGEVGGVQFELYSGWSTSLYYARKRGFHIIAFAYERMSNQPPAQTMREKEAAVFDRMRLEWTSLTGGTAPEVKAKPTPRNKIIRTDTVAHIIRTGLLNGDDVETIIAECHRLIPGTKANRSFVSYQRHHLVKRGLL